MAVLGPTGIEVGDVIFGAGSIGGFGSSPATRGWGLDAEAGRQRLDEAAARGIRLIDTADQYGGGESERVLGRWLPGHDQLVATKVGNVVEGPDRGANLSAAHIARQFRISRDRLGRVDLYLTHQPDPATPREETLSAFAALAADGDIRAYGVSNVDRAELEALLAAADRAGVPRPGWVQNSFNLLDRGDEDGLLPVLAAEGLGYTPYSPLAGGMLSDRYLDGAAPPPRSRLAAGGVDYVHADGVRDRVRELAAIAAGRGVSTAALALSWLRRHPGVTAFIVAPSSAAQWRAVDEMVELDEDAFERIGEL